MQQPISRLTPASLIPVIATPRTIAVDLDDTLNNFTETLQGGEFPYDPAGSLPEATFERYLQKIRNGEYESSDFLSNGFSYCRFKIHLRCWQEARARPDGVEFMRWLKQNQWRIVICTARDLRRGHDCTKTWLQENGIPFDYLFMATNKVVFCKAWGIGHLVDDAALSIVYGERYGVNVYYSIMPHHQSLPGHNARGFQAFEDLETVDPRVTLLKEFCRSFIRDKVKIETEQFGFAYLQQLLSDGGILEYGQLTTTRLVHRYKEVASVS